mgnify:FL=1
MVILTVLSKEDFDKILELYNMGFYKYHKHVSWALANTIYILETTKGKYVLKIFEDSNIKFISYQLGVTNYLIKKKVPVARNIVSRNGKELLSYKNKNFVIQEYVEGHMPKKLNDILIKDIADNMSLMNKYLMSFKTEGKILNLQFKPNKDMIDKINNFEARKEQYELLEEIKTIDCNKLKTGVIHGDFRDINLLVKDNKLKAIIDWDDSHKDYIATDISVFITQFIKKGKIEENNIRLFLKEYQKNLKLKNEEIKAIYYFTLDRLLGVILWQSKQMKIHHDYKKKLMKDQKTIIKDYKALKKYGTKKFMKLNKAKT